jgi:hypothetical protein
MTLDDKQYKATITQRLRRCVIVFCVFRRCHGKKAAFPGFKGAMAGKPPPQDPAMAAS